MQGDDPPYLPVGTAVSAKYKGAFCEAKVSKVVHVVKCKVTYKMGLGTATISDEHIKGVLRVGQLVQAKHMEKKEYVDATITKIQDCSQYTVVFDDGDITTLRRTALCLKSGRHFNESETLDQLPLTHPEHFGNPVVGGRRGRRSRQAKEDSSEGEAEEENEPDLEIYTMEVGRVVCVEASDKKRSKDNWFPGLVVMPSAQPTVRINVKDEFLVRSFKDGRYYTVPQKEVTEFSRDMVAKCESTLAEAVEKAVRYLDSDELPVHWERSLLFNNLMQVATSESDDRCTDSSEDETPEEKDHFVAQLYKFMDDSNTPLNKSPMIGNKDVDLHRLFRVVRKLGGYNRVTNKNKWRSVTLRLKLTNNPSNHNQVKLVYKKFLLSFEAFHRTLGVTMLSHPRNAKKSRGRSLIRDKDRSTPVNSPKPEKEEDAFVEKKEEEKVDEKPKVLKKPEVKPKEEEKKSKEINEISDTNSSDTADFTEVASTSTAKPKRIESKTSRERKVKPPTGEKVKAMVEKLEEQVKNEEKEEDKIQQTRSKSQIPKAKDKEQPPEKKMRDSKTPLPEIPSVSKTPTKVIKKPEDDKKRGRKRFNAEEKTSNSDGSTTDSSSAVPSVNIGDKLKVYYGPTHESKVTYEAKIIEIDKEGTANPMYLVHYTGWNTRYDEWIMPARIAENLSATTKAKKLKQSTTANKASTSKSMSKRGRRMSITGRSTIHDTPRSTTPSSVTSTSSRTKSPGTPVTRTFRSTRQGEVNRRMRRASAQTDISIHSESDSMGTESDSEIIKTRSGVKSEDGNEQSKKKLKHSSRDKRVLKDDDETEKEDEVGVVETKPKRTRKLRKVVESKSTESDEDSGSPPKGRDFDLIQIRSELKGFVKAASLANANSSEKDAVSSDESNNTSDNKLVSSEAEETNTKNTISKSLSSEDIYEFKEPEPFEFETRTKLVDEKKKRLVPRIFEDVEKMPKKKKPVTPTKTPETKEEQDGERKRTKQASVKKLEPLDDDEMSDDSTNRLHVEDPFDKLVESPSFLSGKEKPTGFGENKSRAVKALNLDESLSLFNDLSETAEDDSGDHLDISDTEESQNEPLFTHKEQLFSESTFSKSIPDRPSLDPIFRGFVPKIDRRQKDSDDDDSIRASIQSVINQSSSTDDDSNDLLSINLPFANFSDSKVEKPKTPTLILSSIDSEESLRISEQDSQKSEEKDKEISLPSKDISPALQETDSTLLESVCAQSEILTKLEDTKEITIKTGTKIADSLLQKFSMIESPVEKVGTEASDSEEDDKPIINIKAEIKQESILMSKEEPKVKLEVAIKLQETKLETKPKVESKIKPKLQETKYKPTESKKPVETKLKAKPEAPAPEIKKRARKIVSREFIEETDSDSDSTDSDERLVIARSDEESQTNSSFDIKLDSKETVNETANAESIQVSSDSSFKFGTIKKDLELKVVKPEVDSNKEEEPDSHLHSLLLCEETIPGSPAPAPEGPLITETKSKTKSVLEMPFASAPGTSNNSNKVELVRESKCVPKERVRPLPLALPLDNREKEVQEVSTVLDNTPPMTPESTISNLSPRGDLSPNTADDSCKSGEGDGDYGMQRRGSSNKVSYSEDGSLDTLLNIDCSTSTKKSLDGATASTCRKRRKSFKTTDEVPTKRGRKPLNRSRHTSESDDNAYDVPEQSIMCNSALTSGASLESRLTRSPKPSKYNFYIELDPNLDSAQRIAILQQKLQDIRKTYADVKAELAAVERRRKKLRRREREAKMSAKQESVAT